MSALVGMLHFDGTPSGNNELAPALQAMAHYGTDGVQTHAVDSVVFGHIARWMSPEDHVDAQPLIDGDLMITADIRLDNRDVLLARLGVPAADHAAISDVRLTLLVYRRWGRDCPKHLYGDYAFAIWDRAEQTLFCARDHVGAKPFFYFLHGNIFAFASDINALLALPCVPETLDEARIVRFIAAGIHPMMVSTTETFYQNIDKLAFGHTLQLTPSKSKTPSLSRYWRPEDSPAVRYKTVDEYAHALYERVEAASAARLRTDYPVGAHLSGGLDSSSVAVIAARLLRAQGRELAAFSWSPTPGDDISQTEHARIQAVAHAENLTVHYADIGIEDYIPGSEIDATRDPIDSLTVERRIQRMSASLGVRRIFSGYGGDETASYIARGREVDDFLHGRWRMLAWRLKLRPALSQMVRSRDVARLQTAIGLFWEQVLLPLFPDWLYFRVNASQVFAGKKFLRPQILKQYTLGAAPAGAFPRTLAGLRASQYRMYYYGSFVSRLEDWTVAGAFHNVDYVYPMLDRALMEFVYGIPGTLHSSWYDRGMSATEIRRYLYRRAVEPILPPAWVWDPHLKEEPAIRARAAADMAALTKDGSLSDYRANPWVDVDTYEQVVTHADNKRRSMQRQAYENVAAVRAGLVLTIWQRYRDQFGEAQP